MRPPPGAPSPADTPSLRQRFLGSAAWTAGTRAVLVAFSLAVTAVLARLLDPSDYGLLGMATVFIGLVQQARDLGIGQALVQRETATESMYVQAFSLSLLLSLGLFALCWIFAGLLASFYGEPRVAALLRFLALSFPLTAFHVVPLAMLRRDLRMKGESLARIAASVADAVVTILLAWAGLGVWALASGSLVNGACFALGLAWRQPWKPDLRLPGEEGRSLLRFGGPVTLSSFLWYVYSNADFLLIGRLLGSAALGTYTMAWNLAKMPWDQLWIALSPMVLPLLARSRERGDGMAPAFLRLTRGLSLLTFPALIGLAAIADVVVPLFLGPKWAEVVAPLRWLCLYGVFRSVSVLLSPTLLAAGRIGREIRFNLACVVVLPLVFALAAQRGVAAVAASWAIVFPLVAATLLLPPVLATTGLSASRYLQALGRPALASAVMGGVVWGLGAVAGAGAVPLLALQVATGVATYLLLIRLLEGPGLAVTVKAVLTDVRQGAKA